jgi:phenylalanine ammonia-lyase
VDYLCTRTEKSARHTRLRHHLGTASGRTSPFYFEPVHLRGLVHMIPQTELQLQGQQLSLEDVIAVSRFNRPVCLSEDSRFRGQLECSRNIIREALTNGRAVYGVNTNFGGMADQLLDTTQATHLQENLLWGLKCSVGQQLSIEVVRAAMLIRANALSRGASGVRVELIERLLVFLNFGITPIVRSLGSIGASGDLIPLAQVAGSIIGLSRSYQVDFHGETIDAITALDAVGLKPFSLEAKEGLSLVNGTSVLTSMAVHAVHHATLMLNLVLAIHSLHIQALQGMRDAFDPFVHALKPHPGQAKVAQQMFTLTEGSRLLPERESVRGELMQDRYSIRCLAQYLGPIADGLHQIAGQVTTEMNSADDNPLVDSLQGRIIHGGNFYAQYIAIGMDQLRYYVALVAKHLDIQISLLVAPEFNRGLPASLAFDDGSPVKFGLKGLQICGNSILPRLLHLGQPIVTFFPTYAEQFNQNINSQGFNSAFLANESVELLRYHLAVSCVFAVQGVEQRSFRQDNTYLAGAALSPASAPLYNTVYGVLQKEPSSRHPLVSRNSDQYLDEFVRAIYDDLKDRRSRLLACIPSTMKSEAGAWE